MCGTYHTSDIVACMQFGRFSVSLFHVFQMFHQVANRLAGWTTNVAGKTSCEKQDDLT
jgi:hypothetical protein